MKSLIFGIVLIVLLGVGGFLYKNVMETTGGPTQLACTEEAKVCPDGTGVGRSGPSCEFAPCPFPNVEFIDASLSFALPQGYEQGVQEPGADGYIPEMLNFYQKQAAGTGYHYISVYRYDIPEGKSANEVIIENTLLSPSGELVSGMEKFDPVLIQGRTFNHIVIERFEGQVVSAYYLIRDTDVLRFDVLEQDVDWTNPDLVIETLPEHKNLLTLLSSIQTP